MKALEKKDIKLAEQHLLRATELYPRFSSAFNALGLAYQQDPDKNDKKTGINTAAKNAFRQAVLLNPTNDSALTNLGGALLLENAHAEAESALLRAAAIRADSIRTLALLMYAQALQNHFSDLYITAKRVPEGREKEYPLIFYLRALAWEYKNDPVKAARDYRGFLKFAPSAQEAPLARASLQRLEQK
jgi:Flp pilus assembly protein TadD